MKKRTDLEFKEIIKNLVDLEYMFNEKYIHANHKISCTHNKCGYTWRLRPNTFIRGARCPKCTGVGNVKKTNIEFNQQVEDIYGSEYIFIEKYSGANTKIKCKHDCGNIWKVSPNKFLNERTGCPICKRTPKGEKLIMSWLDSNNIDYIHDRPRPGSGRLRFDFQIDDIVIEFDGRQHFEPVEVFGGESEYIKTKRRDARKNTFCENNDISIVRIHYKDVDLIDDILKETFNDYLERE